MYFEVSPEVRYSRARLEALIDVVCATRDIVCYANQVTGTQGWDIEGRDAVVKESSGSPNVLASAWKAYAEELKHVLEMRAAVLGHQEEWDEWK